MTKISYINRIFKKKKLTANDKCNLRRTCSLIRRNCWFIGIFYHYNSLADLGGVPGAHPLRDTIHWWIQGGGGLPLACASPTGSISFVFAYVFTEKCMRQRLVPPNGLAPPQWEIPPLQFYHFCIHLQQKVPTLEVHAPPNGPMPPLMGNRGSASATNGVSLTEWTTRLIGHPIHHGTSTTLNEPL